MPRDPFQDRWQCPLGRSARSPQPVTGVWRDDRLTFELLRCVRVPTPLTWEPVTATVGHIGPIVCVENHATFRTLLRVLREYEKPQWLAVAWVQGRNTAPLESLTTLPFSVTRLDYLGDLDAAGLTIAASACAVAELTGVPARPATQLWELLLTRPSRPGRPTSEEHTSQLVPADAKRSGWVDSSVRLGGHEFSGPVVVRSPEHA
jgi:hypothetical protein